MEILDALHPLLHVLGHIDPPRVDSATEQATGRGNTHGEPVAGLAVTETSAAPLTRALSAYQPSGDGAVARPVFGCWVSQLRRGEEKHEWESHQGGQTPAAAGRSQYASLVPVQIAFLWPTQLRVDRDHVLLNRLLHVIGDVGTEVPHACVVIREPRITVLL